VRAQPTEHLKDTLSHVANDVRQLSLKFAWEYNRLKCLFKAIVNSITGGIMVAWQLLRQLGCHDVGPEECPGCAKQARQRKRVLRCVVSKGHRSIRSFALKWI